MMTIVKQNRLGFFRTSSLIKVGKLNSENAGGFLHRQTGFVNYDDLCTCYGNMNEFI